LVCAGRAVMLEQPRKSGLRVTSHMLTSHGGEIFIHSIPTGRSILEDPPSISEGPGGRVTDYRIPVRIEISKFPYKKSLKIIDYKYSQMFHYLSFKTFIQMC